jgi:hypothetical protein
MTWKELTNNMTEVKHPSSKATATKKPLQFRMKEGWKRGKPRGHWWKYAPLNKVCVEDKQRAKEEEHTLLLHDAPLTCSKAHTYQRSSGSVYLHTTSPSKSSTMFTKWRQGMLPST